MILNFYSLKGFKGYPTQAVIAIDEMRKPIKNAVYSLSGQKSDKTVITDNNLVFIAEDESAEKLTLTVSDGCEEKCAQIEVSDTKAVEREFDDSNVVLTFSVASDTHVSGSWNQPRSVAKMVHYIESVQELCGRDAEGKTKLDALCVCGDFVDSVNSPGNVSRGEADGTKAAQNYREVSYIRSALEGRSTNNAESSADGAPREILSFGKGLEKGVDFFYCLGNHDESRLGRSSGNEKFTVVESARYFAAVFCGWRYDSKRGVGTPDLYDDSYIGYAEALLTIHLAGESEKEGLIEKFTSDYGVDGKYAYGKFRDYYGGDTDFSDADTGLFSGNRHKVINGVHFIAIETSQSVESEAFLDRWCKCSVDEDETRPIFVFTHEKVYHTIDSSHETGHARLLSVLAKYPQAFVFTGHTHSVLTNANSIMSDCGFTGVEASVLAYLSCEGLIGRGDVPAGNYCRKEDHDSSPVLIIKVDKNNTVRIEKYDLHRTFNENFGGKVYPFGEPWDISGISSSGEHLLKYGRKRSLDEFNNAPVFPDGARATISYTDDGKLFVNFPAATETDDLVRFYKVELEALDGSGEKPWQYITSFAFKYSSQTELLENYPEYSVVFPAEKENRNSENLDRCVEISKIREGVKYKATVTAYDTWHKASERIVSE